MKKILLGICFFVQGLVASQLSSHREIAFVSAESADIGLTLESGDICYFKLINEFGNKRGLIFIAAQKNQTKNQCHCNDLTKEVSSWLDLVNCQLRVESLLDYVALERPSAFSLLSKQGVGNFEIGGYFIKATMQRKGDSRKIHVRDLLPTEK